MSKAPDLSMFTKDEIRQTLDDVRHPVSVAIFGSDNYFNAAAIIRTAHQFLVQEIILVDCPKIYEKATMGTHKWENIVHMSMADFVSRHGVFSSADNRPLIIFEHRPEIPAKNLMTFKYPENPILCFGNEKTGIPVSLLELLDTRKDIPGIGDAAVFIPQWGLQNDLNLANAASIAIYDWTCKWYAQGTKVR